MDSEAGEFQSVSSPLPPHPRRHHRLPPLRLRHPHRRHHGPSPCRPPLRLPRLLRRRLAPPPPPHPALRPLRPDRHPEHRRLPHVARRPLLPPRLRGPSLRPLHPALLPLRLHRLRRLQPASAPALLPPRSPARRPPHRQNPALASPLPLLARLHGHRRRSGLHRLSPPRLPPLASARLRPRPHRRHPPRARPLQASGRPRPALLPRPLSARAAPHTSASCVASIRRRRRAHLPAHHRPSGHDDLAAPHRLLLRRLPRGPHRPVRHRRLPQGHAHPQRPSLRLRRAFPSHPHLLRPRHLPLPPRPRRRRLPCPHLPRHRDRVQRRPCSDAPALAPSLPLRLRSPPLPSPAPHRTPPAAPYRPPLPAPLRPLRRPLPRLVRHHCHRPSPLPHLARPHPALPPAP